MEGPLECQALAPLRVGGLPNEEQRRTRFALEIPYGLSLLAYHDPRAPVKGLNEFAREDWPAIGVVHLAFQTMVGLGSAMTVVAIWAGVVALRRKELRFEPSDRWLLSALAVISPFGFIATEAGWFTTEVGRQPWIVYGVWRTSDAVTPMPGL